MSVQKRSLLYAGKAKSLFETDDADLLIAEFRDDTSAFDGVKTESLADKGATNNTISTHIMRVLAEAGVPTHFVETLTKTEVVVKRLTMVPVECVVRNIAAGSLCRRLGVEPRLPLTPPMYELFLKNDDLHDPLINDNHAIAFGWATADQLSEMKRLTLLINDVLQTMFADVGLTLVDAKFEFGIDAQGKVVLGDEISPDSCRIWEADTLEPLDKDRFRQDMGGVIESYKKIVERLEG